MKTFFILVALTIAGLCYHVNADDDDIFEDIFDFAKRGIEARSRYRSTVRFIFLVADTNRDGLLDAFELSRVTKPKDGSTPLQKARETVRLCDTNGDSKVSQDEMVTYLDNNA